MEFAARLPSDLKLRRGGTKWILKRALRGLVPREILHRPKRGFDIPLDVWLRGEVEDMAHDLLLSSRSLARDYFRLDAIRRMLDEHRSRRWGWQNQIWTLLMLEMWHREIVDEAPVRVEAMAVG